MMNKRDLFIIIVLIIIILSLAVAIFNVFSSHSSSDVAYHEVIVDNASNEPGTVEVIRNIGNPNGKKIAYVVGLHPLENLTHKTLVKLLPNMSNLNYCYDIYIINVTEDVGYYGDGLDNYENPGRQNGQNLAYKYVYPEILNGGYELAIDVHSNIGAYPYKTFVFCPIKEGLGQKYADNVAETCQNITYYSPETTTSGPYLTVPLNENGIPAFYYEEYSFATQDVKDMHMIELISAVDNLQF